MENKGVVFNNERYSYTIEVSGGIYEYLSTIKSLLSVLGGIENEFLERDQRTDICSLITGMLPSEEQMNRILSGEKSDRLEFDNERIKREKVHLESLLAAKEKLIGEKERTIGVLLEKLKIEKERTIEVLLEKSKIEL